ncbi:hypothetical protein Tco_1382657 [Tanacetum coccineum]
MYETCALRKQSTVRLTVGLSPTIILRREKIIDEELREFTSEYYIPFALHPVVPAASESIADFPEGKEPLWESTAGRTMELVLEQPEVESTDVLAPIPLCSVPGATVEPPKLDATSVGSSEDADVAGAESGAGEVDSGLKRKRDTSDDGAGTSKRVRHVSLGGSTSTEEETPNAPPTLAAKEVTETPLPK